MMSLPAILCQASGF